VLTRGPADYPCETFRGDLLDPPSLTEAMIGVEKLYLFPVAETAREVVALAQNSGVLRIVVLSSGAVTTGYDTGFHLFVEQAVVRSGLQWTFVRPGEFMLNKLWLWGPMVRDDRTVYEPHPDAAWCPVHERDVADVAIAALLGSHHSKAYDVNGPAMITRVRRSASTP
jgi:uncharacterized protein YbjT (DUF2867 family)